MWEVIILPIECLFKKVIREESSGVYTVYIDSLPDFVFEPYQVETFCSNDWILDIVLSLVLCFLWEALSSLQIEAVSTDEFQEYWLHALTVLKSPD